MLDKYTFGDSPCAQNLVDIVNGLNDAAVSRATSRFIISNNNMMKQVVKNIPDKHTKRALLQLLAKAIQESKNGLPEKVKTHAQNVLIGTLRDHLEKINKE